MGGNKIHKGWDQSSIIERMIKKKQIYFVRHGESELNALNVRQGSKGHLSPKGREQAAFVAERFIQIPIDVIISSNFERAEETAGIIADKIRAPLVVSELLAERRNPHEIIGRPSDDPEVAAILDRIDRSFHTNELRYSDEENFDDLKDRARALLRFLENRPESSILCVTHHIFLRTVVSFIEIGEKLTSAHLAKFTFLNPLENAGITLCSYAPVEKGWWKWKRREEPRANLGWKLVVWNDYGRFGAEENK